jgi:hypothetical protein
MVTTLLQFNLVFPVKVNLQCGTTETCQAWHSTPPVYWLTISQSLISFLTLDFLSSPAQPVISGGANLWEVPDRANSEPGDFCIGGDPDNHICAAY